MSEIIYISPSHSLDGEIKRMNYLFSRAIKENELMDGIPVEITITPSDNHLYLNDCPLGDYREISNISSDGVFVQFDYGDNGKYRLVMMLNKHSAQICHNFPLGFVLCVHEYTKGKVGGRKCIVDNLTERDSLCQK